MKKILLIATAFGLSFFSVTKAQTTGGPDAFGYTWKTNLAPQGPVFNWIDITTKPTAQQVFGLSDDNTVGSFTIGFPFHYYWYDVTQFWIGSNGYVGFTNGQLSANFPVIPSTAAPNNFLAGMASDLLFTATNGAECWKWTNNTNDTLIVTWKNVPFWDQANPPGIGNNTFQIILSAVDSSITYQYQNQSGTPAQVTSVVGIENNSGTLGLQYMANAYPTTGTAIKFYYPATTNYAVSDASTAFNGNSESAGVFLSKNGSQYSMVTEVKNTGNQPLPSFNVWSRVVNASNTVQVQDNSTVLGLTPGQTQSVTMTQKFNPTAAGIFRFLTNTQLSGDATPSNDQKIQEVVVVDTTTASIKLSYDNGVEAGTGGWSWSGGEGGVGVYFVPPFHPFKLTDVLAYIVDDPNAVGYSMLIFDDSGAGSSPGSLLDSIFVPPTAVSPGSFNTTTLTNPITINSGGVYVVWNMTGIGCALGTNRVAPFSNRGFEYISGAWAPHRNREIEDLMINVKGEVLPGVGISEVGIENYFGNFYPNPSKDFVNLDCHLKTSSAIICNLFDVQGKIIRSFPVNNFADRIILNVEHLENGVYFCQFATGDKSVTRKLIISGK
ncbi:MAG: T9SS type A sorting domain-containing protein [Bacteroidota bacterium]|jgi:hypothetical protein